ncbi:D-galactarate dehydratase [Tropicimonas sp. TH_r6]|uniref:D-galactarate dehydratase n=1 Tax=Tropicimonas sp. TH_r6 TaxID=3082085 RepID=UPI002953CB2B|nr:D-galactarate dehydratase [Tropicimonas sp. TH_r6]MDV7142533.1 D-galactarate dehydratase [Tropicimonas sp. TH_r6]
MTPRILIVLLVLAVAGCSEMTRTQSGNGPLSATAPTETGAGTVVPATNATTVEQFDTTSSAERRAAASAPADIAEVRLGTTVASLGDPADPGFWAETGLVDQVTTGRLEFPGAGTSVKVELRPSGGSPGSGTRVSLPAMRVLEAPLTALPELVVYSS